MQHPNFRADDPTIWAVHITSVGLSVQAKESQVMLKRSGDQVYAKRSQGVPTWSGAHCRWSGAQAQVVWSSGATGLGLRCKWTGDRCNL